MNQSENTLLRGTSSEMHLEHNPTQTLDLDPWPSNDPFTNLPVELLLNIIDHLYRKDVVALLFTSSRMCRIVKPIVYREITLVVKPRFTCKGEENTSENTSAADRRVSIGRCADKLLAAYGKGWIGEEVLGLVEKAIVWGELDVSAKLWDCKELVKVATKYLGQAMDMLKACRNLKSLKLTLKTSVNVTQEEFVTELAKAFYDIPRNIDVALSVYPSLFEPSGVDDDDDEIPNFIREMHPTLQNHYHLSYKLTLDVLTPLIEALPSNVRIKELYLNVNREFVPHLHEVCRGQTEFSRRLVRDMERIQFGSVEPMNCRHSRRRTDFPPTRGEVDMSAMPNVRYLRVMDIIPRILPQNLTYFSWHLIVRSMKFVDMNWNAVSKLTNLTNLDICGSYNKGELEVQDLGVLVNASESLTSVSFKGLKFFTMIWRERPFNHWGDDEYYNWEYEAINLKFTRLVVEANHSLKSVVVSHITDNILETLVQNSSRTLEGLNVFERTCTFSRTPNISTETICKLEACKKLRSLRIVTQPLVDDKLFIRLAQGCDFLDRRLAVQQASVQGNVRGLYIDAQKCQPRTENGYPRSDLRHLPPEEAFQNICRRLLYSPSDYERSPWGDEANNRRAFKWLSKVELAEGLALTPGLFNKPIDQMFTDFQFFRHYTLASSRPCMDQFLVKVNIQLVLDSIAGEQ